MKIFSKDRDYLAFEETSLPVETDEPLYTVLRHVERNALRANLCEAAEGLPDVDGFWIVILFQNRSANRFAALERAKALLLNTKRPTPVSLFATSHPDRQCHVISFSPSSFK